MVKGFNRGPVSTGHEAGKAPRSIEQIKKEQKGIFMATMHALGAKLRSDNVNNNIQAEPQKSIVESSVVKTKLSESMESKKEAQGSDIINAPKEGKEQENAEIQGVTKEEIQELLKKEKERSGYSDFIDGSFFSNNNESQTTDNIISNVEENSSGEVVGQNSISAEINWNPEESQEETEPETKETEIKTVPLSRDELWRNHAEKQAIMGNEAALELAREKELDAIREKFKAEEISTVDKNGKELSDSSLRMKNTAINLRNNREKSLDTDESKKVDPETKEIANKTVTTEVDAWRNIAEKRKEQGDIESAEIAKEKEIDAIRKELTKSGLGTLDKNGKELSNSALRMRYSGYESRKKGAIESEAKVNAETKLNKLKEDVQSGEVTAYQANIKAVEAIKKGDYLKFIALGEVPAKELDGMITEFTDGQNASSEVNKAIAAQLSSELKEQTRLDAIEANEGLAVDSLDELPSELKDAITIMLGKEKLDENRESVIDPRIPDLMKEIVKRESKIGLFGTTKNKEDQKNELLAEFYDVINESASEYGKRLKAEDSSISDEDIASAIAKYSISADKALDIAKRKAAQDTFYGKKVESWGKMSMTKKIALGSVATVAFGSGVGILSAAAIGVGAAGGAAAGTGLATGLFKAGKMKLSLDAGRSESAKNREKSKLEKNIGKVVGRVLGWSRIDKVLANNANKQKQKYASRYEAAQEYAENNINDEKERENYLRVFQRNMRAEQERDSRRNSYIVGAAGMIVGATIAGEAVSIIQDAKLLDGIAENVQDFVENTKEAFGIASDGAEMGGSGNLAIDGDDRYSAIAKSGKNFVHDIEDTLKNRTTRIETEGRPGLAISDGKFELDDINVDYEESLEGRLPGSFGDGYNTESAQTAYESLTEGLTENPEQLASYISPGHGGLLSAEELTDMGISPSIINDPNALADFFHENPGKMVDVLNGLKENMDGMKVDTVTIDAKGGQVYEYGLQHELDAEGKVVDAEIVLGTKLEGPIEAVRIEMPNGNVMYVDPRCENLLVPKPSTDVVVLKVPISPTNNTRVIETGGTNPITEKTSAGITKTEIPEEEIKVKTETGSKIEPEAEPEIDSTEIGEELELKDSTESAISQAGGGQEMEVVNSEIGSAENVTGETELNQTTDGSFEQTIAEQQPATPGYSDAIKEADVFSSDGSIVNNIYTEQGTNSFQ